MKSVKTDWGKILLTSLLLISFGIIAADCYAQSTPTLTLLALSKNGHTLAIVDPVSLKVLAKIPVGPDPHEVIATADGKIAYVSNTGGGQSREINVIDLVGQKALPNIDTRPLIGPHGLDFAAGKVWFSAEGAKAVGRIDPATQLVDWSMGTGQDRTHMVLVSPDGNRIYTTNVNAGTVSILVDTLQAPGMPPPGLPPPGVPPPGAPPQGGQPRKNWIQTVITVSRGCEGFDITPDGQELWTASADDGNIYLINTGSKKLIGKIEAKVLGANRVKFTPDGRRVLVSSLRTGTLFIFDATTHQEIKRINLGHGAAGILVDPDGSRAFVGCTPDNYVAVINLKSLEVSGHIDVGGGPDGLAWALRP